MNYCSQCGSPNLNYVIPPDDSHHRYVCSKCGVVHYDNPRIIVGCLVSHNNRVMLCKRAIEPQYGLWNLPAGFLENGEKAEDGAVRETHEESRASVRILKLHALFSLPKVNQVYLHFLADFMTGHYGPTPESLEVRFFEQHEIPWKEIAFHSTTFALHKYYEFGTAYQGVHVGSYTGKERWNT